MFSLIKRYMENLSIDEVNNFALKNDVTLNPDELNFTYEFIKKNWESILSNPNLLNLERYKNNYTPENFEKIKKLFTEYYQKYGHFL